MSSWSVPFPGAARSCAENWAARWEAGMQPDGKPECLASSPALVTGSRKAPPPLRAPAPVSSRRHLRAGHSAQLVTHESGAKERG